MSHCSLSCPLLFSLMLAGLATPVFAEEEVTRGDVLLIERVHSSESSGVRLPKRGALMATVENEFGAPQSRVAPVGGGSRAQPPITRATADHALGLSRIHRLFRAYACR